MIRTFYYFFAEYFEPSVEERRARLDKYVEYDQVAGTHFCGICKESYGAKCKNRSDAKAVLLNHIEAKHLRISAYFCPYCDRSFYSMSQKTCHISTKHREEHRLARQVRKPKKTENQNTNAVSQSLQWGEDSSITDNVVDVQPFSLE